MQTGYDPSTMRTHKNAAMSRPAGSVRLLGDWSMNDRVTEPKSPLTIHQEPGNERDLVTTACPCRWQYENRLLVNLSALLNIDLEKPYEPGIIIR